MKVMKTKTSKIGFGRYLSVLFIFQLLFSVQANAQVSVNAAYVRMDHTFNYQNGTLDSLMNHVDHMGGGMLGVSLNVPLLGDVGIAPGAYIGFAKARTPAADSTDHDFSTSTINMKVPFYLNFKINLGESVNIVVFGGPVFNVGISKLTNYRNVADQVDLHCDMGATVGAGLQFHRMRLYVGYNIDMIDRDDFSLANKESVKKAWEGSSLFVGLGFVFGDTKN